MSITLFPKPDSKIWNQQNKGDALPILWSTRNINLEKPGYIGLSRRMSYLRKNGGYDVTVMAGVYFPSEALYKFNVAGGGIYNVGTDLNTFSQDTNVGSSSGTTATDMVYWNNTNWYSTPTELRYLSGGTYTATTISLSSSYPHPISIFENKNIICVANGNVVSSRTAGGVDTATALTIPTNFVITKLIYMNNKMYVCTKNTAGGDAYLFEWDGSTASASYGYPVNSSWIMTGTRYGQSIAIVTVRGELLRFSGGGFVQLARLPFYIDQDYEMLGSLTLNAGALPRGMVAVDDYLFIFLINTLYKNRAPTSLPIFPGGVYQYHPDFGLAHRYSISASTQASITDYGQTFIDTPGMIMPLMEAQTIGDNALLSRGSRLFAGTRTTNASLLTDTYLCSVTSGESRGAFTTCKIPTQDITSINQKLYLKWKNMYNSTDKIVVKYRNEERQNLPISINPNAFAITWTSSTTFTASSTNTNIALARVGDEVEVISGGGSGSLAHITAIGTVDTTYTITLDETIVGVSNGDRAGVIIDNWIKAKTITNDNIDGYDEVVVGTEAKWVQFKIELRGENEIQIEELQILNNNQKTAV
ncbi:hypothetical protein E6Q11_03350 [Candidatus Dojkabacteria bacterium]|uniref:Uncharacterized protein n=1 Tax=Candidatus Dojkabacteria bacterium TaxID=2099670 RepID=A0A5C7J6H2_9BACT|nr:MAG: hypothetical protein E6Q11_03350 [Candidatus Dojkabacteria bacterium]